jgi:hypothetical protein
LVIFRNWVWFLRYQYFQKSSYLRIHSKYLRSQVGWVSVHSWSAWHCR